MKRGIIFDFDGVVADTWALHEKCWREVMAKHGAGLPEEELGKALGMSPLETARMLVETCNLPMSPEELAGEKEELFNDRALKDLEPMPGAIQAIQRLSQDFRIILTSMRTRQAADNLLFRGKLNMEVEVVSPKEIEVDTDTVDLYEQAVKDLELLPGSAVAVDDDRIGILSAKRAGLNVIAFDSNPRHEQDFSMADAQVQTLDELVPELINQVVSG